MIVVIAVVNPGLLFFALAAAAPIVFLAYLVWGLWGLVRRRRSKAVTSEMLSPEEPEDPRFAPPASRTRD